MSDRAGVRQCDINKKVWQGTRRTDGREEEREGRWEDENAPRELIADVSRANRASDWTAATSPGEQ